MISLEVTSVRRSFRRHICPLAASGVPN